MKSNNKGQNRMNMSLHFILTGLTVFGNKKCHFMGPLTGFLLYVSAIQNVQTLSVGKPINCC